MNKKYLFLVFCIGFIGCASINQAEQQTVSETDINSEANKKLMLYSDIRNQFCSLADYEDKKFLYQYPFKKDITDANFLELLAASEGIKNYEGYSAKRLNETKSHFINLIKRGCPALRAEPLNHEKFLTTNFDQNNFVSYVCFLTDHESMDLLYSFPFKNKTLEKSIDPYLPESRKINNEEIELINNVKLLCSIDDDLAGGTEE